MNIILIRDFILSVIFIISFISSVIYFLGFIVLLYCYFKDIPVLRGNYGEEVLACPNGIGLTFLGIIPFLNLFILLISAISTFYWISQVGLPKLKEKMNKNNQ